MNAVWIACSRLGRSAAGEAAITCGAPPPATARPISSTCAAPGVPASAVVSRLVIWLWKTAPRPAIPVAIPTWRNVELMPDAMPERAGATTPIAAFAIDGLIMPTPTPATMKPGSSAVHSELGVDAAHQQQADADDQQSAAEQAASGQPRGELARDRGGEERQQRHGQEAQAGLERLVAEDRLQVQREVQEHREHRRRQREGGDRGAAERLLAKQREVEHRPRLPPLDDDEQHQQQRRRREQADDQRRCPSPRSLPLDEREDEQEQRRAERRSGRASRCAPASGSRVSRSLRSVTAIVASPIGRLR